MKNRLLLLCILLCLAICPAVFAQNVAVNDSGTAADTSAILDVSSATKGFLMPRMTTLQRNAIVLPATGLAVFNISVLAYQVNTGTPAAPTWSTLSSGVGSVTSVSVTTANGVSGSVATPTTTPAISLTLGNITPSSVVASGTVSGSNLSGANSGDITLGTANGLSLTGQALSLGLASTSLPGALSATDWNTFNNKGSGSVTNIATGYGLSGGPITTSGTLIVDTATLSNWYLRRKDSAGNVGFTTVYQNSLKQNQLSGSGFVKASGSTITYDNSTYLTGNQSISFAPTGDVTGTTSGTTTLAPVLSIGVNKVTLGQMAQVPTGTFLGRTSALTGNVEAMTTAEAKALLGSGGTNSGDVTLAGQNYLTIAGQVITANPVDLSGLNVTGTLAAARFPALTGDITNTAGLLATTITAGAVSNTKLATMAANTFKANATGGVASPTDINGTTATAMLDNFTSTTKGLVPLSGGGSSNFLRADGTFAVPPGVTSGTVTSVSVTTANGVSGSVLTASTTPAITLTLGAITPTSVAASGTVTGSNLSNTNTGDETLTTIKSKLGITTLSGSNTGDQTITLTGDVTGGGTGSFATAISPNVVSYSRLQQVGASKLIGNPTGISANASEITLGTGLSFSGSTLNYTPATSGTVTSVGLALPGIFNVTNSPVTSAGILTGSLATQASNVIFAGPGTGVATAPTFRSLVAADLPIATTTATTGLGAISVGSGLAITGAGVLSANTQTATGAAGGDLTGSYPNPTLVTSGVTAATYGNNTGSSYPYITVDAKGRITSASTQAITFPAAITSLNGLTAAIQTFGTPGTSGTAPSWSSVTATHTLNIPLASTALVTAGLLSNADYGTFNNKQPQINGTGFVKATGTTISYDNNTYLTGNQSISFAPTGDVTGTTSGATTLAPVLSIGANKVTLGQMAQVATGTFLGRTSALTGNVEAMTTAEAKALLGSGGTNTGDVTLAGQNYLTIAGQVITANPVNLSGTHITGILAGTSFPVLSGAITTTAGSLVTTLAANAVTTATINNLAVTNAKLANMAATSIKGNKTAGIAAAADLTPTEVTAMLNNFTSSLKGLVPTGGSTSTFLRGDATWQPLTSTAWGLTGNAGTSYLTNYIGTTDNNGFRVKVNTAAGGGFQGLLVDSLGNVAVGNSPTFSALPAREKFLVDAGTTTSINAISAKGSINSYLQLNIQNQSAGTTASSDIVATSNTGNETINYVDMGINGSGNTSGVFGVANDAYLFNQGENFFIANSTPAKSLIFMTGGTDSATNERIRILGTGNVGIGNPAPSEKLDITGNIRFSGAVMPNNLPGAAGSFLTSNGANAAPTWTAGISGTNTGDVTIGTANGLSLAGQTLSLGLANTSLNGALSSTDWNTFNNKADTTNVWSIRGNTGTNSGSNFLGTTDNASLSFRSNNIQRMYIDSLTGNVGVGTNTPQADFTVFQKSGVGATRGFRFTGNSIGGVSSGTGFAMSLGYNTATNKQLWLGDADYLGNGAGSFIRYAVISGVPFMDAVNGDATSRKPVIIGVGGDATSGVILGYDANSTAPSSFVWANGNMAIGNSYRANAAPANGLIVEGNSGIGTVLPTEKLDVTGNIKFSGALMPNNAAGAAGSVLTSAGSGLPPTWETTSSTSWALNGNAGTSALTNFLGTTDNQSLRFRTNNIQRVKIDSSTGNVLVGQDTAFDVSNPEKFMINAGVTTSVNAFLARGSINNYLQMNIKNSSNGANATTDIVATADNGNEDSNYVDLGINGSNYSGSAIQTGVANDGYLISKGKDFYVVNSTANKNMLFLTGGSGVANERMRILANGRVGMGVQNPTAPFVVKDTMEIRRVGSLSQLLFTNTGGSGDFRIGGDGGDLFWQGGGGRSLQMGSYWPTILAGDRQSSAYPAFTTLPTGTGILVLGSRDASVPLAIQAFSGTQSANLTQWRNSAGAALSAVSSNGSVGIGNSAPTEKLDVTGNIKFSGTLVAGTDAGTSGNFLKSNGSGATPTWTAITASGLGAITSLNTLTTTSQVFATGSAGNAPQWVSATATHTLNIPLASSAGTVTAGLLSNADWNTFNDKASTINSWSTTGNSVASAQKIGTITNFDFPFITNNLERMRLSAGGNLGIGAAVTDGVNAEKLLVDAGTGSYNVISGKGNLNSYLQLNIKNTNAGAAASSDIVATNDAGTEALQNNFIDMGVNSSGYAAGGVLGGANNAYLYSTGNDLIIGNSTASKPLRFYTTTTAAGSVEAMRIDSLGKLGIGTLSPTEKLDITGNLKFSGALMPNNQPGALGSFLVSGGAGASPTWSTATSGTNTGDITIGTANGLSLAGQVLSLGLSSGSTTGALSSTDWTTFNNKLTTIDTTNIANFSSKVRSRLSAGTGIGYNNTTGVISNTGVTAINGASGNISFPLGNLTEATSSILTIGGGTGSVIGAGTTIQVKQASGAQNGFLSSTDWTTFNTKGSGSITSVGTGYGLSGGPITTTGTLIVDSATLSNYYIRRKDSSMDGGYYPYSTNPKNYLTGNQTITLTGAVTGSGTGSFATTVITNANLTGVITSTGNATSIGSQTGTGSTFAMSVSPTFTGTPTLPTGTIGTTQTAGNSTTALATTAFVTTAANLKANLASPTFTGTVVIPTPFTLGATSVTSTGSQLNYLNGATGVTGTGNLVYSNSPTLISPALGTPSALVGTNITGTATSFTASNVTTNANLTGDVTSVGNATTIANSVVTNAKLANMAINTIKGAVVAGPPVDLNGTQATTILDVFAGSLKGLVPGTSGGSTSNFLRGDGTWAAPSASGWGLSGNAGTTAGTNFLGTTDNKDLQIKTNNTLALTINTNQGVGVGPAPVFQSGPSNREQFLVDAGVTTSTNIISAKGTINSYMQMNVQNKSAGAAASTDLVATANNGDESYAYVDLGINSSAYNDANYNIGGFNDSYLYSVASQGGVGGNLSVGTASANTVLKFHTGGTTTGNERMRISSTGDVGIGSSSFNGTNPEQLLVDAGATGNNNFQNVIVGKGNTNNYAQLNIQNTNAGLSASSDVVATSNNGDESVNYIDMGINSSGNTANYFGGVNDAYLFAVGNGANPGGNLIVGTATASRDIAFLTGGGTKSSGATMNNERMRILGTGNIGIGTATPGQKLDVNGNINAQGSVYVDGAATDNTGALTPGLILGGSGSGEGISSKRTSGGNQYGIDFYTQSSLRMTIFGAAGVNNGNVGIATSTPTSTLQVNGSVSHAIATTSTNYTLDGGDHTLIITGLSPVITLPAATSCSGRVYTIVNETGSTTVLGSSGSYIGYNGGASTQVVANSSMTLQSNGTNWYRIQ